MEEESEPEKVSPEVPLCAPHSGSTHRRQRICARYSHNAKQHKRSSRVVSHFLPLLFNRGNRRIKW